MYTYYNATFILRRTVDDGVEGRYLVSLTTLGTRTQSAGSESWDETVKDWTRWTRTIKERHRQRSVPILTDGPTKDHSHFIRSIGSRTDLSDDSSHQENHDENKSGSRLEWA